MNLDDLLRVYKTSPKEEIRKINNILSRDGYTSLGEYKHLIDLLRDNFLLSEYSLHETTYDSFYSNIIMNVDNYEGESEKEISIEQYRLLSEFIFNLLIVDDPTANNKYRAPFDNDVSQLVKLINNGLQKCGYSIKKRKNKYFTQKIDAEAEAIAAIDKTYQEDIYDYLIAKSIKEKEVALTSLSIKLEAMKPNNGQVKQNRKYVQLLRHKEEKESQDEYAWFFEKNDYSENLEKLFRIYLFLIASNNSFEYIKEFDTNSLKK